jgi:hypothetical protein
MDRSYLSGKKTGNQIWGGQGQWAGPINSFLGDSTFFLELDAYGIPLEGDGFPSEMELPPTVEVDGKTVLDTRNYKCTVLDIIPSLITVEELDLNCNTTYRKAYQDYYMRKLGCLPVNAACYKEAFCDTKIETNVVCTLCIFELDNPCNPCLYPLDEGANYISRITKNISSPCQT